MAEQLDLATLQAWFYRSITHPGEVAQGAAQAAAGLGVGHIGPQDVVRAAGTLGAAERLAIYHNAYHLRLMEVLEAEYPALKLALGDELFRKFALMFIQQSPPSSYTLYQLSARFPDVLRDSVPEAERSMGWPAFIIELAQLERTFQEVYRGPGAEGLPQPSSSDQLALAPSVRLMACSYPVHESLLAARKAQTASWPAPRATWLAICRRDYHVRIHILSKDEYACLNGWPSFPFPAMPTARWVEDGLLVAAHAGPSAGD